jgi:cytosine deaminase
MDLILRNARVIGNESATTDIGIDKGRIAAIRPGLQADGESLDVGGRLVTPGLIETHIHLDKSRILGRCTAERGDLEEAIGEVARQKKLFTSEDVYERAKITLERAILNGTTHMRTQLEVDPGIGLRGLEGVRPLIEEYKWAIDLQVCIFPQEGLLNNPGTDELIVQALRSGGSVVGSSRSPASSTSTSTCISTSARRRTTSTSSTSASSPSASSGAGASPSAT